MADTTDNTKITISPSDLNLQNAPTSVGAGNVENLLMTIYLWAGIVAVVVIIIGGFWYTTANGNQDRIKSGKNTILYAVIGLVIIIMAAAITQFVINNVG